MNNHQPAKSKIFLQALKIAVLSVGLALVIFNPMPVAAADAYIPSGVNKLDKCVDAKQLDVGTTQGGGMTITVFDKKTADATQRIACVDTRNGLERALDQVKTWFMEKALEELKKSGAIAYKAAIKNFLDTLAYDMATYLATGDKGQLPMFQTQGWGGYLSNVADNAAGTFIEQFGKSGLGGLKFNLCNPDINVLLRINLGLFQARRPKAPACTFSQMTKNWDTALKDKNFLPKFQDMFNPWSNDIGIALTLQTGMENQINKEVNSAIKDREEGAGFKAVKDEISGFIKTPARTVLNASSDTFAKSSDNLFVYTGQAVADSVDIFINTLIGKLITKWLKGGLATSFPKITNKLDSLTNINAQNSAEGLAGAQDRMKSIVEPNFKVRADYDILAELATCPDPNKAGPTNCVIDEKFRQAIEKKMTVGEALKQGYLSNSLFGFLAAGRKDNTTPEPRFNEGYPYRSMIILRKYRIIPVGWEVAAQKINDGVGVSDVHTLGDLVNCFSSSDDYKGYNDEGSQTWCADLVDPDWVLMAPQNFCAREGAGSEILSQQVTGEGSGSSLAVLRNDTYCADEQSVITEKSDGSPVYGYCTEERRKWDFNANSCAPISNTCQTFGSSAGQTNSYLENTLDFGFCNPGNVGCQEYAIASSTDGYNSTAKAVKWENSSQTVYLNKQAESCDSSSEGCHAFIRLNSGGGANLLINADFEDPTIGDWGSFGAINTIEHYQGKQSLAITGAHSREIYVGETGYSLAGESYALSFYAKCASGGSFWLGDKSKLSTLAPDANNWIKYNSVYTYPESMSISNEVTFSITSNSCLIDNIKLERSSQVTDFSDYGAANSPSLIHEKLMPDYLMNSCYVEVGDHYAPISTAPAICSDFARKCKKDEVGCELYTSATSGNKIPAKTIAQDYCPAECVGYNVFIQNETPFDSKRDAYFIPKTAKTCGAEAAGCDEFTNLEQATTTTPNVAENKEYYSSLRQCLKKSENEGSCGEFYTWEGSDESGFQLKVESLVLEENGKGGPFLTTGTYNDPNVCDQTVYNLPVGDPHHNDDCRQFYSHAGTVFYALYANTKTCSENCHPYRRTEVNELTVAECQASCPAGDDNCKNSCSNAGDCSSVQLASKKDRCKLANDGPIILCKSGGLWSADNNACIYMAIPGQGATCSAAQTGCREYTGNTGNNIRNIFTDDFGNGVGSWTGVSGARCHDPKDANKEILCVAPSNEAISLGSDNKGHSLQVTLPFSGGDKAIAERQIGTAVRKGLDYVLKIVARAETGNPALTVSLSNGSGASQIFAPAPNAPAPALKTGWWIFEVNLTGLNHEADADEILRLSAGGTFYIDNITLTEITDRYYLIKNSWQTPDSCDEDLEGVRHEHYMLYCDQYTDRASKTQNLKQFNKLCSESAVGCELMIDTHNSSNPAEETFNASDSASKIIVPADSPAYVVYDTEKFCGAEEKGCERLGQAYKYESTTLYGDAYLKNNPDKYNQILCGADAVGCDVFTFSNGTIDNGEKYFKDPRDMVCEWRRAAGAGASESWLKKKIKRCDDGVDIIAGVNTVNAANGKIDAAIDAAGVPLAPKEDNVCLSDSNCSIVTGKDKCSKDSDCGTGSNVCGGAVGAKKCSVTGNSCNSTNDCSPLTKCVSGSCHYSCITDNNDYVCPTDEKSKPKTLGLGGSSPIIQPAKDNNVNWAGLCPAADSGCTEYVDPVSKFNSNQIFNGSFADLDGKPSTVDGWAVSGTSYTQSRSLEPNTVYRLGSTAGVGLLKLNDCSVVSGASTPILYEIGVDNSLLAKPEIITASGNSKVFYYKGEVNASCTITAENSSGAVELKKVAIDYQLAQNLDAKSCNGQVNTGQGCVLFNERSQSGAGLAALKWDADRTVSGAPAGGVTTQAERDLNDSNIILKVAPDRVCDKWLACKSYIKDAKGNNVCFDVGLCDAVDASGNCQSFIRTNKANQVAGAVGLDISNLSGYSKVGISGGSLKTDYYPFGSMKQYGEVANVSNGGFEYSGSNGYPVGWSWGSAISTLADKPWNVGIFSVVNNPIAVQSEGIGYAPEGAAFLKLGSSYEAVSEQIDVIPGADYTITAYVNTKNLKNGQAQIYIMDKNYIAGHPDSGTVIPSTISPQDVGTDWSFKMGKFSIPDGVSQIKIKLYSSGTPEGNFYFDDIKIRPALNSRTDLAKSPATDWYTAQSCRLYPQSNSLACDYYEDSGKRQKGWPGYCLEYDRRPGDPNTCLLWYPIDKVKGDGVEEGAGYLGKTPVYYCVGGKSEVVYEYRHAYLARSGNYDNCNSICPINYKGSMSGCSEQDGPDWVSCTCYPEGKDAIIKDGSVNNFLIKGTGTCKDSWGGTIKKPVSENDGWYPYDEPLVELKSIDTLPIHPEIATTSPYAKYLCTSDGVTPNSVVGCGSADKECSCTLDRELYRSKAYCTDVVQTVTAAGQNKYWSSRVYEGSDYIVDPSGLNYGYGTDATPFGSMVPPSSNPYDWDGQPTKDNNQPIYYSTDKTIIRSGKGYGCMGCNFIVDDSAQNNFPYAYEDLPNPTSMTGVETGVELVKSLFAQSYGAWDWKGSHYESSAIISGWGPPGANGETNPICSDNPRPADSTDYCAILPEVIDIKVNGLPVKPGDVAKVEFINSQFIKLSFNTRADSQQLPLVMYGVDWGGGDGSQTIVTGVEMRDKPNPEQPEIIYHLYSYWDLKATFNSNQCGVGGSCSNFVCSGVPDAGKGCVLCSGDNCQVKPSVKIRDNWGWSSNGSTINDGGAWEQFDGVIKVMEKGTPVSGSAGGLPAACSCTDGDRDGHYPLTCLDPNCSPRDDCNDSDPAIYVGCLASPCSDGSQRQCGSNNVEVGTCKYDKQTCIGGAWSTECGGGVGPITENCGNILDDDCDGTINNGCPAVLTCLLPNGNNVTCPYTVSSPTTMTFTRAQMNSGINFSIEGIAGSSITSAEVIIIAGAGGAWLTGRLALSSGSGAWSRNLLKDLTIGNYNFLVNVVANSVTNTAYIPFTIN